MGGCLGGGEGADVTGNGAEALWSEGVGLGVSGAVGICGLGSRRFFLVVSGRIQTRLVFVI